MAIMILLIHDLQGEDVVNLVSSYQEKPTVIADDGTIRHCTGCFACWVKTPGECVLADSYSDMGSLLAGCKEVHIVSACVYGGYSHFVKNVVDRSISFVHPYFLIRRGETHHKPRYAQTPDHHVWFYGQDLSEAEKETARALVAANTLNNGCNAYSVTFVRDPREIRVGGSRDASRFNQR